MPTEKPVVVVVGAGLAGLACAARLSPAVDIVLLEARDRVGGRCWSSHGWADGQVAEHGGELIEKGQDHILGLVDELGLELERRQPHTPAVGFVSLGGRRVPIDEVDGFPALTRLLAAELLDVAGVTADTADDRARQLDEMSALDWIDSRVDGGAGSRLGLALSAMVALNLGLEPAALSALSLHHMLIGFTDPGERASFAFGNESATGDTAADNDDPKFADVVRAAVTHTFHVKGGNDQIAIGLADHLPAGVLQLQAPVVAIRRQSDGRYSVTTSGSPKQIDADRVVLANPLATLRRVDLSDAQLSPRRLEAIEQIPMGTHSKILLQLTARPDALSTWPGFAVSDNPPVATWDTSAGQVGAAGLLTMFGPSPLPSTIRDGHGPLPPDVRSYAIDVMNNISPDLPPHLAQRAWVDAWADDPWSMGSYLGYGPGQYTRFSGFLSQPEGGIHFAGEHTSLSSPGYLDGAVGSGYRAAREVLSSLAVD